MYHQVPIDVYGLSPPCLCHLYVYYLAPIHLHGPSPPSLWDHSVYYVALLAIPQCRFDLHTSIKLNAV